MENKKITVRAFAKLNLFLDIVGLKENGYHLLEMIMQSVNIFDDITISKINSNEIVIKCSDKTIPTDERNIAHKACKLFLEALNNSINEYDENISVDDIVLSCENTMGIGVSLNSGSINLENNKADNTSLNDGTSIFVNNNDQNGYLIEIAKNIPHQAGMAGGSADAAGVLFGLNKIFGDPFTSVRLAHLGEKLGADVPFALCGGTCKVEGIGEIIKPLPKLPECIILVAKPDKGISTKVAFEKFDNSFNPSVAKKDNGFEDIITALENSDINMASKFMFNKFETLAPLDEVTEIKKIMLENGALNAIMTGSGSAVFGVFSMQDKEKAQICCKKLSSKFSFAQVTTPTNQGVAHISAN